MKTSRLRRLDVVTLFPSMFEGPLSQSLLGRARDRGIIQLNIHDLRDYSADERHRSVDDRPYGGGAGMVLQAEPLFEALRKIRAAGRKALGKGARPRVVLLSPQGSVFAQKKAQELARRSWVILICGHYEGIDERLMRWVDEEISIGDFVLTGGEIPAMVVADAAIRLVPGVVKEADSIRHDSFQEGLLDHPHYTRPALWRGYSVPAVLLSGDHEEIRRWRSRQALAATLRKRPDLAPPARELNLKPRSGPSPSRISL